MVLLAGVLFVIVGATLSILYGPALMPALQLPAASQTWPEAIITAVPFVPVDCVKDA